MNAAKKILILFMVLVFLGGLAYALYPTVNGVILTTSAEYAAEVFLNKTEIVQALTPAIEDIDIPVETKVPYKDLLEAMEAYNEEIYREAQAGLCDAWAYQEPSFDLADYGIEAGVIGVISIPKLDIEMPIYLGATYNNMAKGAAHLSQTSLPIGGANTNCVIAGHRGWNGADYFRYIDRLEPGDTVTITNLWEELTYTVSEIKIIDPNDVDEILIRDGKDMLTLLTCHPYGSGGKYRYVIYCERLLSSSRVIEGMFYKGVVATEADADAVFYQRLFQKIGASDEIHFVNAHNKQTLKKVIQPYQTLGIKFALIADADVIRDKVEFQSIIDGIVEDTQKELIMNEREVVYSFFQKLDKHTILTQLKQKTQVFASHDIPATDDDPQIIASALFDFRKGLKKLRDDADELATLKEQGRKALDADVTTQHEFDKLVEHCAAYGLFIVPVGELESWLVDYGLARSSNKTKWITQALEKLFEIDYDSGKQIWKFIDSLKTYLTST